VHLENIPINGMRVLLQRVSEAKVAIGREVVARIGPGMLVLAGIAPDDAAADLEWMARKVAQMRIFADAEGKMNRSLGDVGGEVLAVSQFTLHASTAKGNRPSFTAAAPGEIAGPLFDRFVAMLESLLGQPVATGVFGADMQVALVNDGPVTVWLDSRTRE
jgi:D-tyrosyl-tRNA(Tyr) deacylase